MKPRVVLSVISSEFAAVLLVATSCLPLSAQSKEGTPGQRDPHSSKTGEQSDQAQMRRAIKGLSSSKFRERQAAYELLVAAGNSAVDLLEKSAKTRDLELATRIVETLTVLAGNAETRDTALAALERLAKSSNDRVAKVAAKAVKELKTTNEERAIAALTAEGVRIFRSSRGGIFSVTIATDNQLALLRHLNKLRTVRIRGEGVTDDGLDHLADVKELTSLTISRSAVTDAGLQKLKALKSLDRLSLSGSTWTGDGLWHLRHVPNLRMVSLHSPIDENALRLLAEIPKLDSLYLSKVSLTQTGIEILNQLDQLTRLSLTVTAADDEQLSRVGQLKVRMHLMVMSSPNVTAAGWKHLNGAGLTGLSIAQTPITDATLSQIGKFRTLESLIIMNAPISDAGLEGLQELKALRSIVLQNTNVTHDGLARFEKSLPNLRHARTDGNPFGAGPAPFRRKAVHFSIDERTGNKNALLQARLTPAVVKELKKEEPLNWVSLPLGEAKDDDLASLKDVDFQTLMVESKHVTDRGVKHLENHLTLERLFLTSTSITDRSLESVARIPALTGLTIQVAPLTDRAVRQMIEQLSETNQLEWLHFHQCPTLTNDSLAQIGQLTTLEHLFLNNNDGLTSGLLKEIAKLKNLKQLAIDSISLDDADFEHLTALSKLETLRLTCSAPKPQLSDRCLDHVGQVRSLRSLMIQNARITDAGVAMISKDLPNLTKLKLAGTKLTNAGMIHLAKLRRLGMLWLENTEVGDEGLKQLDGLTALKYIYLNESKVSDEGSQRIREKHPAATIRLN